jgi:hypothetical protein
MMHTGGNDAKIKTRLSKSSPFEVKMLIEFIRRGISGDVMKETQPAFAWPRGAEAGASNHSAR